MQKFFHWICGVTLCAASLFAGAATADELVLGVQYYDKSPRLVMLEFREMSKYLSGKLGQPVIVEPVQSYQRYMERAKQKRYDFMFAPPSMIMEANALAGYEPVVKVPGQLAAAFMSLANGPIAFPEDMKGKRIGMPEENSPSPCWPSPSCARCTSTPESIFPRSWCSTTPTTSSARSSSA